MELTCPLMILVCDFDNHKIRINVNQIVSFYENDERGTDIYLTNNVILNVRDSIEEIWRQWYGK